MPTKRKSESDDSCPRTAAAAATQEFSHDRQAHTTREELGNFYEDEGVIAYLLSGHERHAGQLFRDGRLEIAVLVFAVMLEVGSCREVLAVNLRLGVFEICVRVTWRGILRGVGTHFHSQTASRLPLPPSEL